MKQYEDRFYIEPSASTEGEMKTLQKDPYSETNKRNLHPVVFYLIGANASKNKIEY